MRFFLSLFFIAFCIPTAMAQDVYLKPNPSVIKETPAPQAAPEQQIEEMLGQKKPAAQPTNIQDYANNYYKDCLRQQHPVLKGKELELLCACTSAKFAENMTIEQIQHINSGSKEGVFQRNRILMFVYAPCIEFPTRALIMDQCMKDTKNQHTMKNQAKTCACLADGVAQDMKARAPDVIRTALQYNQNDLDPLATLMNSNAFESRAKHHSLKCLQYHELGFGMPR